ncbi:MAG: hydroxymethylglutaryl-CoA lyase [Flavobacteriales bacterium]|nr:hydroxymethylglutaryl-CoA lyase [Flavobacteriales bacterium]
MQGKVRIIECPRDAMQGMKTWIPTEDKIRYINLLLKAGFDTIDFGSFVSEKAVPQMKDTAEVLRNLNLQGATSRLLAIVANTRGAETACTFDEIHYLGYPFSISETFQVRNTNATLEESLNRVDEINQLVTKHKKELVIYLSMGFGNPYGDAWSPEIAITWSERIYDEFGVKVIALSDTIGHATPEIITHLFSTLIPALPEVEFGAHLHTLPHESKIKVEAAWKSGCRRFDGAIKGFGGCPMAADELTGNMPTEDMLTYFHDAGIETGVSQEILQEAWRMAGEVFPAH